MSGNRSLTVAAHVWLSHFRFARILTSFTVALLYSWLLWLRGLSVLRFAGRSPLPDSSHKEEAGRRFFGGERLPRAAHPVPRDRRGGVGAQADPALALGALIFRRKPLAGIRPLSESSARLSREAAALVRWTILPTVHSHCRGLVKCGWGGLRSCDPGLPSRALLWRWGMFLANVETPDVGPEADAARQEARATSGRFVPPLCGM